MERIQSLIACSLSQGWENRPPPHIWQLLSEFQTHGPNGPVVSLLGIYSTDVFHWAEGHAQGYLLWHHFYRTRHKCLLRGAWLNAWHCKIMGSQQLSKGKRKKEKDILPPDIGRYTERVR